MWGLVPSDLVPSSGHQTSGWSDIFIMIDLACIARVCENTCVLNEVGARDLRHDVPG